MTSADKLGMVVAVAVVIIFVGLGVGMSNVSEDNARPDIDQQRAISDPAVPVKPGTGTGPTIDTGGSGSDGTTGILEICGDGIDNDGDGRIDEAPPPDRVLIGIVVMFLEMIILVKIFVVLA